MSQMALTQYLNSQKEHWRLHKVFCKEPPKAPATQSEPNTVPVATAGGDGGTSKPKRERRNKKSKDGNSAAEAKSIDQLPEVD